MRALGLVLVLLAASYSISAPVRGFLSPQRMLTEGIRGDQSFYLWAVERALQSRSFGDYILNCEWSPQHCLDLRAVPQEWNSFYGIGRAGRALGLDAFETVFVWQSLSLLLNCVAAFFFIGSVVNSPRGWVLAGAIACAVGLQQSAVARIGGHFSLIALWPAVFALAFFWRALEALYLGRRSFAPNLLGLGASLSGLILTSFYYTAFGVVLFPAIFFAFWRIHRPKLLDPQVRLRVVAGVLVSVAFGLAALAPARYLVFGIEGVNRHAASHWRTNSDVWLYSARWKDFVRPRRHSAAYRALQSIGIPMDSRHSDAETAHSFLGLTFLFFLIWNLRRAYLERKASLSPEELHRNPSRAFLAAFFITAFFATAHGGLIIHALLPAIRSYNRLAPFVALFGAAAIVESLSRERRWAILACVLFLGVTIEASSQAFLDGERLVDTARLKPVIARLEGECLTRRLRLEPAVGDLMLGPYTLYFMAKKAHCELEGVAGPGARPSAAPRKQWSSSPVIVRWDAIDSFHPVRELVFSEKDRMPLEDLI